MLLWDVREAVTHPECEGHVTKYKAYEKSNSKKHEAYQAAPAAAISMPKFSGEKKHLRTDLSADVPLSVEEKPLHHFRLGDRS